MRFRASLHEPVLTDRGSERGGAFRHRDRGHTSYRLQMRRRREKLQCLSYGLLSLLAASAAQPMAIYPFTVFLISAGVIARRADSYSCQGSLRRRDKRSGVLRRLK